LSAVVALAVFSGCSDDSVSPGTGSTTTMEWTIENPTFFAKGLNAVWAASPSDVWAAGENGELIHFDGSAWERVEGGMDGRFHDLFGISAQCVFAVGERGAMAYDGSEWRSLEFAGGTYLVSVWAASENDVFALGGPLYGTSRLFRYNGSAWSEMDCPPDVYLQDLWGSSAVDVYGVGSHGSMIHYNGTEWTRVDLPVIANDINFEGVFGSSTVDVYAVGEGLILHYDGSGWSAVEYPPPPGSQPSYTCAFLEVWVGQTGEVYAVESNYGILHFDGTSWRWVAWDGGVRRWVQTAGIGGSGSDVYVADGSSSSVHYDGQAWESMMGPVADLHGVWGASDEDVFAVGDKGTILHFDGVNWSQMDSRTCGNLQDVWGTSGNDVFAVGSWGVCHYDGSTWERMGASGTNLSGVAAVWGTSPFDVFCTGTSGIHNFNGSSWTTWPTGGELGGLWGTSHNDVYAGGGIALFHFTGSKWTVLPVGGGVHIETLDGTTGFEDVLYAAGRTASRYEGVVARLDGLEWKTIHVLPREDWSDVILRGLWVGGTGTIAAVGGSPPLISFFDGRDWEDVSLGDRLPDWARQNCSSDWGCALNDVWSADGIRFFAVGDGGLIVRGERQASD
jgi:hypothetical protein